MFNSIWKRLVFVGVIASLSLCFVFSYLHDVSVSDVGVPQDLRESIGIPYRIRIPSIGIDSQIESVGVTKDAELEAPLDPLIVGWFALGPRPGQMGSAVIDGHYGWVNKRAAAFDRLSAIRVGSQIFVESKNGNSEVFVVRELRVFGKQENTKPVFFSDDGKSHLNLITCEGKWNKVSQSYAERLVVMSERVVLE